MIKLKKKLILLGDSVFDNIAYLDRDEKSVTQHLQSKLDTSLWDITVEAVDGATTKTIKHQYTKAGLDM